MIKIAEVEGSAGSLLIQKLFYSLSLFSQVEPALRMQRRLWRESVELSNLWKSAPYLPKCTREPTVGFTTKRSFPVSHSRALIVRFLLYGSHAGLHTALFCTVGEAVRSGLTDGRAI